MFSFRSIFSFFALGSSLTVAAQVQPLTLEEAIHLALKNNQRVIVSEFSPQISAANVLTEYGRFDPELSFSRSEGETETPGTYLSPLSRPFTQTDDYALSLGGTAPWGLSYSLEASAQNNRASSTGLTDSYSSFAGLSITQPLLRDFGFSANLANLRIAKANRHISKWQHRQTVIDVVTNVIFVFNNLQQAQANLRIATLSRDLAARLFSENQTRRRIGDTSDAEVTQAEARVASREEAILNTERNVRNIENQLRLLIGRSDFQSEGTQLAIVSLPPATPIKVNAADDYQQALEARPDYQAARLGLNVSRFSHRYARNQLLPRVDFVGSYGYGGLDEKFRTSREQIRNRDARAYSAGLVVRVTLTFAQNRGRERAAKLFMRQSEAKLIQLEQDIALTIATAAGEITTTQKRVEVARHALDLGRQSLANEEKRLKAGTTTTFFVLQQQEQLAQVENSYARALADQRRALANYARETATTLERHQITLSDE